MDRVKKFIGFFRQFETYRVTKVEFFKQRETIGNEGEVRAIDRFHA